MLAWVTEGLTAPGVLAEFGRMAPAALTEMLPVVWVWIWLGATDTVGAVAVGVRTAAKVRLDDDGVGLSDTAAVEV